MENKNVKCEALVNTLSTFKLVDQYQNMSLISKTYLKRKCAVHMFKGIKFCRSCFDLKCLIRHGFFNAMKDGEVRTIHMRNSATQLLAFGSKSYATTVLESSWNVMANSDAREEKWRGNKKIQWVSSKRHMTAEHRLARAVQTLQDDVHSSPASSRLNWRPRRFK